MERWNDDCGQHGDDNGSDTLMSNDEVTHHRIAVRPDLVEFYLTCLDYAALARSRQSLSRRSGLLPAVEQTERRRAGILEVPNDEEEWDDAKAA